MFFPYLWFLYCIAVQATLVRKHDETFMPDFSLRVTVKNISQGCFIRESVVVNGTSPGPTLRIKPNKVTWIRVYNDMADQNLTMHWHGLSQRMAIFSDGTPVSQWPIAPMHYFDYEILPGESDAGTSFYHSHVGFQAVTANGALIVEDVRSPPYHYDGERVLQLTDYFNKTDSVIEQGLTSNPFVWSGETNGLLINGVGVGIGKQNDSSCKLPVVDVLPGKIYRMRIIGATALSHVSIAFESHENLTIIAADARYTQPHLKGLNRTQFWIQFETRDRPSVYRGYASLRYKIPGAKRAITPPAPSTAPLSLPNTTYSWLEYSLQPLIPNNFPTAAEVTRRITMTVQQFQNGSIYWSQNGLNWTDTQTRTPMLIDIYKRGDAAMPNHTRALQNNNWDPITKFWSAEIGEVLEMIIQNTGSLVKNAGGLDIHPFHAHGGHFYDIGCGNGLYDAVANEEKLQGYQPVLRDTTMLYRYADVGEAGKDASWRGWRLRVNQAGVYVIHCHILQHMIMGMSTGWVFGTSASEIQNIPYNDISGYLDFGGNAYGSAALYPEVVEYFKDVGPEI
ncbi:L-ascorbate oxidase [Aureobasidium pullulans]|uniref:L-ascorbate oxidase n=1 Tax=Aureobasidium pullulans TaxID=5580 RepID=A0AB74J3G5_AURPU|nr:L-ascorbate oxidase [Aureobasidium pullulans]